MKMTNKQREFWANCNNKRYNIKSGATRSGKTFLDYYLIPKRVMERDGSGLIVILGHTKGTIQRNIIEPMQEMYGTEYVSDISSDNTLKLFGKRAYALGADKKSRVDILRGASFQYVYGDEVATWSPEVFSMIHSRMDKPDSVFDGTCNPDDPNHWFKEFIDNSDNVYHQKYTLYDNPYNPPDFVKALEDEYRGTIYFDRYILGEWVRAEGVIYKDFAAKYEDYEIDLEDIPELGYIAIGVDFGGTGSKHAFVATGITADFSDVIILMSRRIETGIEPNELSSKFADFLIEVEDTFGRVNVIYTDSAEQVLPLGFRSELRNRGLGNRVIRGSRKIRVNDRIRLVGSLIGTRRLWYTKLAQSAKEALSQSLWDEKVIGQEVRLDNGTTDVDTLDAFEYTIETNYRRLMINAK